MDETEKKQAVEKLYKMIAESPQLKLKDFLGDNHRLSTFNNVLYRYLLGDEIESRVNGTFYNGYPAARIIECLFNAAYNIINKIEKDDCPQVNIEEYFYLATIYLREYLKLEHPIDQQGIDYYAAHTMGIIYAIIDIPYNHDNVDEFPDILLTMLSLRKDIYIQSGRSTNLHDIMRIYVTLIDVNNDWKKYKTEYIKKNDQPKTEYEQKIRVELLKSLFHKYNIQFATQQKEAKVISILTGGNESKINGLLSSPTTIIPAKYHKKVAELNDFLKSAGLDIELKTK